MEIVIKKATQKNKKLQAIIYQNDKKQKTVPFGDNRYQDFTTHKNPQRKNNYDQRHIKEKNEGLWQNKKENLYKPAYYAKQVLWNDNTSNLNQAIKDVEKKQKVKIINKI